MSWTILSLTGASLAALALLRRRRPKSPKSNDESEASGDTSGGDTPSPAPRPKQPSSPPPNVSGDPAGYNTQMFPASSAVRSGFQSLGYSTRTDPVGVHPSTRAFQEDYNAIAAGLASGAVVPPAEVAPAVVALFRGHLDTDGIAGRYTLRALEIALMYLQAGGRWYPLVQQAKGGG